MIEKKYDLEKSELKIFVEFEKKKWNLEQKKTFENLKNNLVVKGFRKGKVPNEIAKKHLSSKDIWIKTVDKVIDECAKKAYEAIDKEKDRIIGEPNYSIDKISNEELKLVFLFSIFPKMEKLNYKNLNVKFEKPIINNEDVEQEIKLLIEKYAILKDKEEKIIAKNDLVTFDFEGFIDGNSFDGGKAENYQLEIGSNKFIPGFEEALIGKTIGDFEINIKFPKTYHVEKIAGKDCLFKIKMKNISIKTLPELNEEFLKKIDKNLKNRNDLFQDIKTKLEIQRKMASKQKFVYEIFEILKKQDNFIIPKTIIAKETNKNFEDLIKKLKNNNLTLEKYLENLKKTKEELHKEMENVSHQRMLETFFLAEIIHREKIELEEKDFEKGYQELASHYKMDVNEVKKRFTNDQLRTPLINEKVVDLLIEWNSK